MIIKAAVATLLVAYAAVSGCGATNSHKPPACEGSKPSAWFDKPSRLGDVFTFPVSICASSTGRVEVFALSSSAASAVQVSLTAFGSYLTHYTTPLTLTRTDVTNITLIAATDAPRHSNGCHQFWLNLPKDGKRGVFVKLPKTCRQLAMANV